MAFPRRFLFLSEDLSKNVEDFLVSFLFGLLGAACPLVVFGARASAAGLERKSNMKLRSKENVNSHLSSFSESGLSGSLAAGSMGNLASMVSLAAGSMGYSASMVSPTS